MPDETAVSIETPAEPVEHAPAAQAKRTPYFTPGRIARRLLLLLVIYLSSAAAIAWLSVRPQHKHPLRTPKNMGMAFEAVHFESMDGTRLAGWYVPARKAPKGVIVLCHGVDGTRTSMLAAADILHRAGYAVLLFDFRARGESEGSRSTLGWKETEDVFAALKEVHMRPELKKLPLGLYGHSMGGSTALMAAAGAREVRAVVAESPYSRLDHAVDNHFRAIPFGIGLIMEPPVRWFGERMIGVQPEYVRPISVVHRISPRAVMIIEDENDKLCPTAETQAIYTECEEPKELWQVPNAGHIGAEEVAPKEFEHRLVVFFDKYLHY